MPMASNSSHSAIPTSVFIAENVAGSASQFCRQRELVVSLFDPLTALRLLPTELYPRKVENNMMRGKDFSKVPRGGDTWALQFRDLQFTIGAA
jgi:hypothetical protein